MTRGVYGRELALVGGPDAQYSGRNERRRLNDDIATVSAELTKAMLDRGYLTHDPMYATDDSVLRDNLARAELAAHHHGGVVPQGPLIDLFVGPWFSLVTEWRVFHDKIPEPAPEFIARFRKRLDEIHATFNVLDKRVGTVPPRPVPPTPTLPKLPQAPSPPGASDGGTWWGGDDKPPPLPPSPPPEPTTKPGMPESVKIAIAGALAIGGIVALAMGMKSR